VEDKGLGTLDALQTGALCSRLCPRGSVLHSNSGPAQLYRRCEPAKATHVSVQANLAVRKLLRLFLMCTTRGGSLF